LDQIGVLLFSLPILVFSVIVHECAHGVVALWRGDPTARMAGRLTLNPIPHIDPIGSVILPGLLLLQGSGWLFGWAKPVPVDHRYLHDPESDSIKVAVAGPLSNLLLATLFAAALSLSWNVFHWYHPAIQLICEWGIKINVVLAIFNLLPIPPLDGHWVVLRYLPPRVAEAYQRIGFLGIVLILVLFMVPGVSYWLIHVPGNFLIELICRATGVPIA
jgi:Zn-dependent protease